MSKYIHERDFTEDNPHRFMTKNNNAGQVVEYYEHPEEGDEGHILCKIQDVWFDSGFYDLASITEDDYVPVLVSNGKVVHTFEVTKEEITALYLESCGEVVTEPRPMHKGTTQRKPALLKKGDIVQVISDTGTKYAPLGNIGRVTRRARKEAIVYVDFSLSVKPFCGELSEDTEWGVMPEHLTKINVIKAT